MVILVAVFRDESVDRPLHVTARRLKLQQKLDLKNKFPRKRFIFSRRMRDFIGKKKREQS